MKALIVDDNPTAREIMVGIVKSFGWEWNDAASSMEALALIDEATKVGRPYQVILVDWRMPGMDGLRFGQEVRVRLGHEATPIIVMVTARGREALAEVDSSDRVLDVFLTKPVTASMIFDAVANVQGGFAEKTAAKPAMPSSRRLEDLRILLVEDNAINQQVAAELLNNEGALVEIAADGRRAIATLRANSQAFDLVLMDIQMPNMDGLEATRAIRTDLGLKDLPIIAITANAMASDREAAIAAGMNDHVAKPFDIDQLVNAIDRVLRRQNGIVKSNTNGHCANPELRAPGLRGDLALPRFGGNQSIYRRALSRFPEDALALVDALPTFIASNQTSEVRRNLHTLKGLSATIGALNLARVADEAESAGLSGLNALLPQLRQAAREAIAGVERIMSRLDDGSSAATAKAEKEPATSDEIRKLAALLESANLDSLSMFEKLKVKEIDPDPQVVQALDSSIHRLDFPDALRICNSILQQLDRSS